jgi:hypothetical protein
MKTLESKNFEELLSITRMLSRISTALIKAFLHLNNASSKDV